MESLLYGSLILLLYLPYSVVKWFWSFIYSTNSACIQIPNSPSPCSRGLGSSTGIAVMPELWWSWVRLPPKSWDLFFFQINLRTILYVYKCHRFVLIYFLTLVKGWGTYTPRLSRRLLVPSSCNSLKIVTFCMKWAVFSNLLTYMHMYMCMYSGVSRLKF